MNAAASRKPSAAAVAESEYDRLVREVRENPFRMFSVGEMVTLTKINEKKMSRLRKLSAKDAKTDPWSNDLTRPEKFFEWYWGRRFSLEAENPGI